MVRFFTCLFSSGVAAAVVAAANPRATSVEYVTPEASTFSLRGPSSRAGNSTTLRTEDFGGRLSELRIQHIWRETEAKVLEVMHRVAPSEKSEELLSLTKVVRWKVVLGLLFLAGLLGARLSVVWRRPIFAVGAAVVSSCCWRWHAAQEDASELELTSANGAADEVVAGAVWPAKAKLAVAAISSESTAHGHVSMDGDGAVGPNVLVEAQTSNAEGHASDQRCYARAGRWLRRRRPRLLRRPVVFIWALWMAFHHFHDLSRLSSGFSMPGARQQAVEESEHVEHSGKPLAEFWGEVSPRILVAEITVVVMLSLAFESWEHRMRHYFEKASDHVGGKILDVLFKEFTGLGFIGLWLFLVTQCGAADWLAAKLMGDEPQHSHGGGENPLKETFETVHMMIFMLMVVLLMQAFAILKVAGHVSEMWTTFERTRAYGERANSLESMFVSAGFLAKAPNSNAPRGFDLTFQQPFVYGDQFLKRTCARMFRNDTLHELVMWRALRHYFLFPNDASDLEASSSYSGPVPTPQFFSFSSYLRCRLGKTVLKLVEVTTQTWTLTMVLLIPLFYFLLHLSFTSVEGVQCLMAWALFFAAVSLTSLLDEDIFRLTPGVPEDARHVLKLFAGTSDLALRADCAVRTGSNGEASPSHKTTAAPGLGNCDERKRSLFVPPFIQQYGMRGGLIGRLTSQQYMQAVQLITFWQAIYVTSLVISFLSKPLGCWQNLGLYCLAWVEWPLMIMYALPVLIRKLTIRNSIGHEADKSVIRQVTLEGKESLLRNHLRQVQLLGFLRSAIDSDAPWTKFTRNGTALFSFLPNFAFVEQPSQPAQSSAFSREVSAFERQGSEFSRQVTVTSSLKWTTSVSEWNTRSAKKAYRIGRDIFQQLPHSQRQVIWYMFEFLDSDNDGFISAREIAEQLVTTTFSDASPQLSQNLAASCSHSLINLVDHDGTRKLTWEKFQAAIALATCNSTTEQMRDDISAFFDSIDKAVIDKVTVLELSEWLAKRFRGMNVDDIASLMHHYFGHAKPLVSKEEFHDWMISLLGVDTHGHGDTGTHAHGH